MIEYNPLPIKKLIEGFLEDKVAFRSEVGGHYLHYEFMLSYAFEAKRTSDEGTDKFNRLGKKIVNQFNKRIMGIYTKFDELRLKGEYDSSTWVKKEALPALNYMRQLAPRIKKFRIFYENEIFTFESYVSKQGDNFKFE